MHSSPYLTPAIPSISTAPILFDQCAVNVHGRDLQFEVFLVVQQQLALNLASTLKSARSKVMEARCRR
jgi:hypothetical protein